MVLLIDDDPTVRSLLGALLRRDEQTANSGVIVDE